jgi:hypothetical protein
MQSTFGNIEGVVIQPNYKTVEIIASICNHLTIMIIALSDEVCSLARCRAHSNAQASASYTLLQQFKYMFPPKRHKNTCIADQF